MFSFLRNRQIFLKWLCYFTYPPQCMRIPFSPQTHQHLFLYVLVTIVILVGQELHFFCIPALKHVTQQESREVFLVELLPNFPKISFFLLGIIFPIVLAFPDCMPAPHCLLSEKTVTEYSSQCFVFFLP